MKKVTIGITTYNLEKYIAECLDSILMQKTNFDFDILVADDASTDKTRDILENYQANYPERIKLLLYETNEGSLKTSNKLFSNIKTEYFSFVDGDDYWLDVNRLQKQVDFLDNNPEYVMVGGQTQYLKNNILADFVISNEYLNKTYSVENYFNNEVPFVHTSSILLRNVVYMNGMPKQYIENENTVYNCVFRGEDKRFVDHLKFGKLFVMPDIFSIYRIHDKGIWTSASQFNKLFSNFATSYYDFKTNQNVEKVKQFYYSRFLLNVKGVCNYINAFGYNISEKDSKLFTTLLNKIAEDQILDWNIITVDLKKQKYENTKLKMKYKLLLKIYNYCKNVLTKKGYID